MLIFLSNKFYFKTKRRNNFKNLKIRKIETLKKIKNKININKEIFRRLQKTNIIYDSLSEINEVNIKIEKRLNKLAEKYLNFMKNNLYIINQIYNILIYFTY